MTKMTFKHENSNRVLQKIRSMLMKVEYMTAANIAEELHLNKTSVNAYLKYMREEIKILHIEKWVKILKKNLSYVSYMYIPAYGLGGTKDAKKPKYKSNTERSRLNRARRRKDPLRSLDLVKKQQREYIRRSVAKPKSDPLVSMFFGRQ